MSVSKRATTSLIAAALLTGVAAGYTADRARERWWPETGDVRWSIRGTDPQKLYLSLGTRPLCWMELSEETRAGMTAAMKP